MFQFWTDSGPLEVFSDITLFFSPVHLPTTLAWCQWSKCRCCQFVSNTILLLSSRVPPFMLAKVFGWHDPGTICEGNTIKSRDTQRLCCVELNLLKVLSVIKCSCQGFGPWVLLRYSPKLKNQFYLLIFWHYFFNGLMDKSTIIIIVFGHWYRTFISSKALSWRFGMICYDYRLYRFQCYQLLYCALFMVEVVFVCFINVYPVGKYIQNRIIDSQCLGNYSVAGRRTSPERVQIHTVSTDCWENMKRDTLLSSRKSYFSTNFHQKRNFYVILRCTL